MKHEQVTAALGKATQLDSVAASALGKCDVANIVLVVLDALPFKNPILRTARSLLRGAIGDWKKREGCP